MFIVALWSFGLWIFYVYGNLMILSSRRSSAGDKKECKKYKDKLVTDIKKINKSKLEMVFAGLYI